MKRNYSLLIIGNIYDNHLIRFVKYLKKENSGIKIDIVSVKQDKKNVQEIISIVNSVFFLPAMRCNKIPAIRTLLFLTSYVFTFRSIINNKKYDIVNIHFPTYEQVFIIPYLKKITTNIVLTPWGSDVYRVGRTKRFLLKFLYGVATYVTGLKNRFRRDFSNIFNVPEEKIITLSLGSESIEYFAVKKEYISMNVAKTKLGLDGKYVITCGYNAAKAQQHVKIIKAINEIRDKLPLNFVLLFPFTYPKDINYINEIKQMIDDLHLNAVYFEEYLDLDSLFYMRQATDMFVHIQTTDANNGSLKEYVLLNKTIVNGSWLKYDDLDSFPVKPYVLVNKLEDLSAAILYAYQAELPDVDPELVEELKQIGASFLAKKWNNFFSSISN